MDIRLAPFSPGLQGNGAEPTAVAIGTDGCYSEGMRPLVLLAAICLAAWPQDAPAAGKGGVAKKSSGEKYPADKDTVRLVEHVTSVPTGDLDPRLIPPFIAVDWKSLPKRLQARQRAKAAELNALRKISEGKRKAPIRLAGQEEVATCDFEDGDPAYVETLRQSGFEEISQDEENFLMRRAKCTQCELISEFTLKIVIVPDGGEKGSAASYRFLSGSDPLMALVAQYREKRVGTDFFGAFTAACR